MIYDQLNAVALVVKLYDGRHEAQGGPAALHPIRVARAVAEIGGDPEMVVAALLHDAVEDKLIQLDNIERLFGPSVSRLVDALSRRDGEPYVDYLSRLAESGRRPSLIKMCDLADNIDRVAALGPARADSLRRRYVEALAFFREAVA